ncbi:MAG: hypothetical protein LBB54_02620, partial [Cellulomonadaceae bacterium]|nr:hypothetical protein [Cellulomonadaceae bacterium]
MVEAGLPVLSVAVLVDELRGHETVHVVVVPADVSPDEVEILASARFAAARWELAPVSAVRAGDVSRAGVGEVGVLRLSRHSRVLGPFVAPSGSDLAFAVVVPRERWEAHPHDGVVDPDGVAQAFPGGLPAREEDRVVAWCVDVARRLRGTVAVDVVEGGSGGGVSSLVASALTIVPDAGADGALTVFSPVWLDPAACEHVVHGVESSARLLTTTAAQPAPPALDDVPVPGNASTQSGVVATMPGMITDAAPTMVGGSVLPDATGELTPEQVAFIQQASAAFDAEALAEPVTLDGYGLVAQDGRVPGWLSVEVGSEESAVLPLPVRGLDWAADGCIAYRVRWDAPSEYAGQVDHAGPAFQAARRTAASVVVSVVRALWQACGGMIADDAGFLIDPA